MQHGQHNEGERRSWDGAGESSAAVRMPAANALTSASAGGADAQSTDIRLGGLAVGLLALLMGAQVVNQGLKGGRE
jgi:hypothetical protein